MSKNRISAILALLIACAPPLVLSANQDDKQASRYWPEWRGPLGTGAAPHANPPIQWSEEKNVRWKLELPGKGHSTPVVWGNSLFLTTAIPFGDPLKPRFSGAPGAHDNSPITHRHRFVVMCVSRVTGRTVWQRVVREALPHEGGHYSASMASGSPVTDGELVFAYFGSYGLYCFTVEGEMQWKTDFGRMQTKHGHGEGSSPALYQNTLVVNWDHRGRSFVVALDKRTGRKIWKKDREEVTSWATPIIVDHPGRPQVVISGTDRVRGYDLATGETVWECGGLSANVVASPVSSGQMVYVASSYDTRALLAIRLDGAQGDITGTNHIVWSRQRGTPYVPSPVLYRDTLYFLRHYQGILSRVDARTGEEKGGPFRLGPIGDVYSSPIGAANRIYITDLDGTTLVISHTEVPRVISVNQLDDSFSASAVPVGDELYLRGKRFLYCIAKE